LTLRGHVDEIYTSRVTGWALDDSDPRKSLRVDVEVNGRCFGSPAADRPRPDVEKAYGGGDHGFVYEFDPPLPIVRESHVRVLFNGTQQVLPKGERLLSAVSIEPGGRLAPILISASGRAGSTVLMQKLAAHPAISVANLYPFETELLKYYSHAFTVLSSFGDHEKSGRPESFIDNHRFLGANPFFMRPFQNAFKDQQRFSRFYQDFVPRELARSFRDIVAGYYLSLAEDAGKTKVSYFAEKNQLAGNARWFARNVFGTVREIVLIRDLRDTRCSFRSFWSKPAAEAMRLLMLSYNAIMAVQEEGRSDVLFIKYEDLMLHEKATMRTVAAFLDVGEFPHEDLTAQAALFERHATSKSPTSSIGRWKQDLSADEIKQTTQTFEPFLRAFGYEV
jgi:hypothetical protein